MNYLLVTNSLTGILTKEVNEAIFQKFIFTILLSYIIPSFISLFFYCCYIRVFKKKKKNENLNEKKVKIIDIFGYLIYSEQEN